MTLEELRDRIKNEVVLHEGELADWQWRQKGLVAEASELGITDFTRLVNDISRQVNRDFGKILDLKKKIVTVALQRRKKLSDADLNQFVTEAERVQLSKAFVTEQWIPAILAEIPDSLLPAEAEASSPVSPPNPLPAEVKPPVPPTPVPEPPAEKVESIRKKIRSILDDYDKHIQALSLKFLFKAVDYDEDELAEEIRLYLSEHYYASVNPPRGNTLKEKLISTDWRHLSWWEKEQPKSNSESAGYVKTQTGYTSIPTAGSQAPANRPIPSPLPPPEKPPQMVPPRIIPQEAPRRRSFSDAALIGLAILSALVLIWVVLKITRGGEIDPEPDPKPKKSQTSPKPGADRNSKGKGLSHGRSKKGKSESKESNPKADERLSGSTKTGRSQFEDGERKTEKPVSAAFDKVDENVGEYGLRPAQKGKFWGYINEKNKWIIDPQFDLATPFNNGKASVELDGNQFFIDRYGSRIRDDN
ncbi:WG repeat-containing protein [Larkinella terrae]|uniref:WG repeat-containing protein n=1 Tax=Larkinella terrae TaxID=2025311 RepID=A0A7K0EST1_9BACT|nr:WG repeat-containing protein [Larkinella terrae]MRS64468.1 hypothetical protein [Larkinella terrae]